MYSYGQYESESLNSIKGWIDFIDENGIPGAAMLLVGNKVDVPEEERRITTKQGQDLARDLGLSFFETSARDHLNIDAAFRTLVVEVMQRVEAKQLEYRSPDQDRVHRLTLSRQEQESQSQQNRKRWC